MKYRVSCHCGAVTAELDAPESITAHECNCSICRSSGFLGVIVPASSFRLVGGESALTTYRFNTGVAHHTFCATCGVKPFYVPRSNPDGYSVNVRCLDPVPRQVTVEPFDGVHWEDHAAGLAHLSRG